MKYLKDKSYYEEHYDKATIQECRLAEKIVSESKDEDIKKGKKPAKGYTTDEMYQYANDILLYVETGVRYMKKESTIQKWMEEDRQRDELFEKKEPLVYCPGCNKKMQFTFKHLEEKFESPEMRVLYLYRCDSCDKKRGVYDNGEIYIFKGDICPECKSELKVVTKEQKNKTTVKSICKKCGYNNTRTYDLTDEPKTEEIDPDFEKDKARFCLSVEDGDKYCEWITTLEYVMGNIEDKEEHKEAYEKAKKTKILTIAQLSGLLSKKLAQENFGSLMVSNPEIGRDLIISFNIQDMKADRPESHSKTDLKRTLNDLLLDTNWHLMSDGLNYKLGVLSGRLKGQDSQDHIYEDLKKD